MKKILTSIVILMALFAGPVVAYAVENADPMAPAGPAQDDGLAHPRPIPCVPSLPCVSESRQKSGAETRSYVLQEYGTELMVTFLGLIALVSVGFIIWGGLQMHIAMGVEDAISKAKKTVTFAIIGLVVAMLAGAIVTVITKISF